MSTSKSLKRAARALATERGLSYTAALATAKAESTPIMRESDYRPTPFDPTRRAIVSGSLASGKSMWANAMRTHNHMLGRPQIRLSDNNFIDRAPGALVGERSIHVHELPVGSIDPLRAAPGSPVARMLALEFVLACAPDEARRYVSLLELEAATSVRELVRRCAASSISVIAEAGMSALELLDHPYLAMLGESEDAPDLDSILSGPTTIITRGDSSDVGSVFGKIALAIRAMSVFSIGHHLGTRGNLTLDEIEQHGAEAIVYHRAGLDALHLALVSQPAPFIITTDVGSHLCVRMSSIDDADHYELSMSTSPAIRLLESPIDDRRCVQSHDGVASMMPLRRGKDIVRGSIARRNDEFTMLRHQPEGFEHWCLLDSSLADGLTVTLDTLLASEGSLNPLQMAREAGELEGLLGQTDSSEVPVMPSL